MAPGDLIKIQKSHKVHQSIVQRQLKVKYIEFNGEITNKRYIAP